MVPKGGQFELRWTSSLKVGSTNQRDNLDCILMSCFDVTVFENTLGKLVVQAEWMSLNVVAYNILHQQFAWQVLFMYAVI